ETVNHFSNAVSALPQIVECHLMAGDCDFLLRVVARDLDDYRHHRGRDRNRECRGLEEGL
ncbi:Lrp/AsnC ligand binding domain-containing protein, partial [Pseudogemmobacter sp. CC-YST710]|nr:Lrp/AsnC ligand binding domain-containing protein [Pseudogemmobacter faecipullorum]